MEGKTQVSAVHYSLNKKERTGSALPCCLFTPLEFLPNQNTISGSKWVGMCMVLNTVRGFWMP